jgi:DNA-binding MarR family transcriptional regulator
MSDSSRLNTLMIGALVHTISRDLRQRVTAALHARGFTDYRTTYHDVFMLMGPEGNRVGELAKWAGITRQAMSEMLADLERLGFVERVADPTDRRAVLVRRTDQGWEVNTIARQVVGETQRAWSARVGAARYAEMLESLRQIVGLIEPPGVGVAGHPRTAAHPPADSVLGDDADVSPRQREREPS